MGKQFRQPGIKPSDSLVVFKVRGEFESFLKPKLDANAIRPVWQDFLSHVIVARLMSKLSHLDNCLSRKRREMWPQLSYDIKRIAITSRSP